MDRARRQIEGVSVPVQHARPGRELRQGRGAAGGAQSHAGPPDLLESGAVDLGAEPARHQLCAEADAEHRLAHLESLLEQRDLGLEERIAVVLVDADRPAEHHQQIAIRELRGREIVGRRVAIARLVAARRQRRREGVEILEGDVADGDGRRHQTTPETGSTLNGRASRASISRSIAAPLCRMASTAWAIGISMPSFCASATQAADEATPSATERRSARTSASLRPSPSAMPSDRLRDCRLVQVSVRSPSPERPIRVSALPPLATARRTISASPRVISAARALSPNFLPMTMPQAIAITFLTAPPTCAPIGSPDR